MSFSKCKAAVHGCCLTTLLISRPGSIPVYRFTEIGQRRMKIVCIISLVSLLVISTYMWLIRSVL